MSPSSISLWQLAEHRRGCCRHGGAVLRFRSHDEPGPGGLRLPVAAAENSSLFQELKTGRQAEDTSQLQFADRPETGSCRCMKGTGTELQPGRKTEITMRTVLQLVIAGHLIAGCGNAM